MRLGKGVVDFWMETVELNRTWSLHKSLDGLRSENGGGRHGTKEDLCLESRLQV